MKTRTAWQEFFDGHAPQYLQNCFTKNTVAEVDFLIDALGLSAGAFVLDVGCGTGRHAIELARRGYRVTGVDLSAGMLEQAKKEAQAAGVEVQFFDPLGLTQVKIYLAILENTNKKSLSHR